MSRIAGLIQARTLNERCENKMLRPFSGTNLVTLALRKFSKNPRNFNLYFAAHEPELIEIGKNFPCTIIQRDAKSCRSDNIREVFNYLPQIKEDYIMFINACCPFLSLNTVERVAKFFLNNQPKSLTAVTTSKEWYYHLDGTPINFLDPTVLDTKATHPVLKVAQCIHIFSKERFMKHGCFWSHGENDPYFFEIDPIEAVDIDTELEFHMAECLYERYAGRLSRNTCDSNLENLKNIKMLVMDVDGVLTDAGMYYSESGDELKKFNTRDGMGISLIHKAGIITAFITQENTKIVVNRAKKLKIHELHQGVYDKLEVVKSLLKKYGLTLEEVAYIGDDINDLPLLEAVGFAITTRDSMHIVKNHVDYITRSKGGEGAVREVCELILKRKRRIGQK